jgi:hypothetical protein
MKVLILAGLITAATVPFAAASETEIDCQLDETRRTSAQQRIDPAPPPPAPAATPARPTVAQREAVETPSRPAAERRRNGKPVPDAELMSPRGVL